MKIIEYHLESLLQIVLNQKTRTLILSRIWSFLQIKCKRVLLKLYHPTLLLIVYLWRVIMSKGQSVNFYKTINYIGSTDNKHNVKSLQYQIIGGSCVNLMVKYVLYIDLILIAIILSELWLPSHFTSYLFFWGLCLLNHLKILWRFYIKNKQAFTRLLCTCYGENCLYELKASCNQQCLKSNFISICIFLDEFCWFTTPSGSCI